MLELKTGTTMSGYIYYFIINIYFFFNLVYVCMGEGATPLCCVEVRGQLAGVDIQYIAHAVRMLKSPFVASLFIMWAYPCHGEPVEVRGQSNWSWFCLSLYWFWVFSLGCRAWRQAPLSTQLSFCLEIFEAATVKLDAGIQLDCSCLFLYLADSSILV